MQEFFGSNSRTSPNSISELQYYNEKGDRGNRGGTRKQGGKKTKETQRDEETRETKRRETKATEGDKEARETGTQRKPTFLSLGCIRNLINFVII